ncbi:hypothetical protein HELRODRAFT_106488 [Helobdella robusta]|uniref:alpha-1,2-Mannosidase n=1 Tax=Helobdella robusta TaxID=6412 RepID=T1EE29_HELRO|nr:hypothetical protein HELRODRAFT_106488 [Helobdella robusta]ESO02141.1 hypothetical protein HELRODRAFT_106488 [Helobdella robusta]
MINNFLFFNLISVLLISYVLESSFLKFPFTDEFTKKYGSFPETKRQQALEESRRMFYFGYDNYMRHAFPKDELDPIHCTGRGPDYDNPSNININDVLGDYALTLVDSLDTLAILGNKTEFLKAVNLIITHVSFDKSNTVQIFEANIRVLGALLSAHLLIIDPDQPFGELYPLHLYNNELLNLAHDLGVRLLSAFDHSATGLPHPRVNLRTGVPCNSLNETCTAGAGTLRLEFGILSHLLDDPIYDRAAKLAVETLWSLRSNVTGLFGNVVNIQTGRWVGTMSGLGAGLDSYYEYLFKSFIMFGDEQDLQKFNEIYEAIRIYMRKGRKDCNYGSGFPPIYVNVNMNNGELVNNWVDSLQAAWSGVQVLAGDIEEAICSHAFFYAIWKRYNALPERYNWLLHVAEVLFYPLRPEFVESTYHLYRATMNPFYLHVGYEILQSIEQHCKVKCGYATRHDVTSSEMEDRMESFFLSETCKYLYLLFDERNPVNVKSDEYLFSTEGHILPLLPEFRKKTFETDFQSYTNFPLNLSTIKVKRQLNITRKDNRQSEERRYMMPIQPHYLQQVQQMIGAASTGL